MTARASNESCILGLFNLQPQDRKPARTRRRHDPASNPTMRHFFRTHLTPAAVMQAADAFFPAIQLPATSSQARSRTFGGALGTMTLSARPEGGHYTFVEVSSDGSAWSPVGKVFGSTAGIDQAFIKNVMAWGGKFDALTIHPYRGVLDDLGYMRELQEVKNLKILEGRFEKILDQLLILIPA